MCNEKLFFYDSLIEVYEVAMGEDTMWGFTLVFNNEREDSEVVGKNPKEAVSSAKLRALENFILRSPQLSWLTIYQSDEVLSISPSAMKKFGDIREWRMDKLFQKSLDRAAFLQKVTLEGTASSPARMFNLDGKLMEGILTSRLINRGEDIAFLLEEFELRNVAA